MFSLFRLIPAQVRQHYTDGMSFDDRLRQAIERGQKRGEAREHEAEKRAMTAITKGSMRACSASSLLSARRVSSTPMVATTATRYPNRL